MRNALASVLAAAIVIATLDLLLVGLTPAVRAVVAHPLWTFSVFGFLAVSALLTAIRHQRRAARPDRYDVIAMAACGVFIIAELLVFIQALGSLPPSYATHLAAAMATLSGTGEAIPACGSGVPAPDTAVRNPAWLSRDSATGVCALPARAGYHARYSGADGTWGFFLLPNSLHTGWVFDAGTFSGIGVAACRSMAALHVPGWTVRINGQPASEAACRYPYDNTILVSHPAPLTAASGT